MAKISKIEPSVPVIQQKKKVAAYARISMETERMSHSLSAQVSYYNDLIQKNPEWEYAGVFVDDSITGTSIVKRQGFQDMIKAADEGKIDIILTKSIQRFARNTVDLLETVRHLKDIGVEVRFEKEHINSMSGDGELMLTILASFAQEESRSISDNVKWGIRKRMQQGITNNPRGFFGYDWVDDHLVINPEEAVIVKRIFQNFLDGKSRLETEREFAAEGITTRQGYRWTDSNIRVVLTNINYTGNMLLQKEYIEDPITKKRRKNKGELPQYFVENTHEAIIDMETFQYVQDEMARRRKLGPRANKSLNLTCFSGKIKCPYCGYSYMHERRRKNGFEQEFWTCGSKKKKKVGDGCPVKGSINHKSLKKACCAVLNLDEFDDGVFLEKVDHIEVPKEYVLDIFLKDGTKQRIDAPNTGHKDCWTEEYRKRTSEKRKKKIGVKGQTVFTSKLKCPYCDCNFRIQSQKLKDGRMDYYRCAEHGENCKCRGLRRDGLEATLKDVMDLDEFSEKVFEEKVDYIVVHDIDKLDVHMRDGSMKTVRYIHPIKDKYPRSEESLREMSEKIKERWTPERRQKASEHLRKMREERGKEWGRR